jgi:hypothetical protein
VTSLVLLLDPLHILLLLHRFRSLLLKFLVARTRRRTPGRMVALPQELQAEQAVRAAVLVVVAQAVVAARGGMW